MEKFVNPTNNRGGGSSYSDTVWNISCYWWVKQILIELERLCEMAMMESGIQTFPETFIAWIIYLIDSILTSLEWLKIIKLVSGMKPIKKSALDSSTSTSTLTFSISTLELVEMLLVLKMKVVELSTNNHSSLKWKFLVGSVCLLDVIMWKILYIGRYKSNKAWYLSYLNIMIQNW